MWLKNFIAVVVATNIATTVFVEKWKRKEVVTTGGKVGAERWHTQREEKIHEREEGCIDMKPQAI